MSEIIKSFTEMKYKRWDLKKTTDKPIIDGNVPPKNEYPKNNKRNSIKDLNYRRLKI